MTDLAVTTTPDAGEGQGEKAPAIENEDRQPRSNNTNTNTNTLPKFFVFKGYCPAKQGHEAKYNTSVDYKTADDYDGTYIVPARCAASNGFVRCWDFRPTSNGKHTMVSVRKVKGDETAGAINGFVVGYRCELGELRGMLDSVKGATLEARPVTAFECIGWQSLPPEVKTIYVQSSHPSKIHPPTPEYPILQSYLDENLDKMLPYGEDFCREWLDTTRGFSKFWLDDRPLGRRPWLHTPNYLLLNELCRNHPPPETIHNTFAYRSLDVEYATTCRRILSLDLEDHDQMRKTQSKEHTTAHLESANIRDFLLGFGSLINTPSRVKSDPTAHDALLVRVSASAGLTRKWNFQHPEAQITALGVSYDAEKEGMPFNGVLWPIQGSLADLDAREVGYTRVEISGDWLTHLSWQPIPTRRDGGERCSVWCYVPDGPALSPGVGLQPASFHNPILQSYVDICVLGCLEHSEEAAIEFITSTFGWEDAWLNDRPLGRRPWVEQPAYRIIDALLEKHCPNDSFRRRKVPEEFGELRSSGVYSGVLRSALGERKSTLELRF